MTQICAWPVGHHILVGVLGEEESLHAICLHPADLPGLDWQHELLAQKGIPMVPLRAPLEFAMDSRFDWQELAVPRVLSQVEGKLSRAAVRLGITHKTLKGWLSGRRKNGSWG